jgi:signal transduction histidine kinase
VPSLGHIVPGAECCAIFLIDRLKLQLYPQAIANLSKEFVYDLVDTGEGVKLLKKLAEQSTPDLLIHLPGSECLITLRRLARKEGIKTIWLIPWHQKDASIYGAFLFGSRQLFSPDKESLAAITFLAGWMSTILRQIKTGRQAHGQELSDLDHMMEEINRLKQEQTTTVSTGQKYVSPYFSSDVEDMIIRIFKDKDGIPVIYDARSKERELNEPDQISILSHELLSPLTLIKGYSATLLQLRDVINEGQKDRYLKGIESAANRLIRLLENLRDLAQLEETDSYTHSPTSISDVMQEIVSEIQSQTTTHFIKYRSGPSLPKVNINRQRMEQVITNLLYNSIKYSPEGSDVEITISHFQHRSEIEKQSTNAPNIRFPCLVVSISDSGIGIPEDEIEKIFERSYRSHNRLTQATSGFGIGLYICRVIVEAYGGSIWASNKPKGGSIFHFSLPLEE